MKAPHRWPLTVSSFDLARRLRLAVWILRNRQWTAGPEVRAYEQRWEAITGATHAIMVGNGSLANELVARRCRHELERDGHWLKRNRVVFPVCTWPTSVTPWLAAGFQPVWVEISPNLCGSFDQICEAITDRKSVGAVFFSSLLGRTGYLPELEKLCTKHGIFLGVDNCEASFSRTHDILGAPGRHCCSYGTSTTSFYFSHHTTTGTEGGMIFTNNDEAAEWFRMARNHGLTRGMPEHYRNPNIDPLFDFCIEGTNARSSDLQAYMGSLVLDRSIAFAARRVAMADRFFTLLDRERFYYPAPSEREPLMSLPIIPHPTRRDVGDMKAHIHRVLHAQGIEYRPIVAGNLLRQTAFKRYGDASKFPLAEWVHKAGVYVGLHERVTDDMIENLAHALNA